MAWVVVGIVLMVAGFGLVRRLPPPFNLGMGVTALLLGGWAAWVGVQGFLGGAASGCEVTTLHGAAASEQAPGWTILREACLGEPLRFRVEVMPASSAWPWPRVVFRSRGAPEPRGVRVQDARSFSVMVDGDAKGQARALPVVLQGLLATPDRVWIFQDGRALHE